MTLAASVPGPSQKRVNNYKKTHISLSQFNIEKNILN